jgi:hypothetical protein
MTDFGGRNWAASVAFSLIRSASGARKFAPRRQGHTAIMLIFKTLHILSMFAAVTFLIGEALFYAAAIWRGDVAGLAAVRRLVGGRPVVGVSFLVAGMECGLRGAEATARPGPTRVGWAPVSEARCRWLRTPHRR